MRGTGNRAPVIYQYYKYYESTNFYAGKGYLAGFVEERH